MLHIVLFLGAQRKEMVYITGLDLAVESIRSILETLFLEAMCQFDTCSHAPAVRAFVIADKSVYLNLLCGYYQINPVTYRTGNSALVAANLRFGAVTFVSVRIKTTGTWIGGTDQQKIGRIFVYVLETADLYRAVLQGLTERFYAFLGKFGELIHE